MRYMLAPNNTLIVRGPACLQLLQGVASILGAPVERSRELVVRHERQLPIESNSEVDLEINLGSAGEIFEIEGSTIPASWQKAVEAVAEMRRGKVMVIGATDVGKSTLCTYLVNKLSPRGLNLRVVDADIGQADLGPPTTIGTSVPRGFLSSLVDLIPEELIFIGHTSPSQVETKLINGISRLSNRGQDSITIINTDGWILDPEAVSYKMKMIAATKPNLTLGIAAGTELQRIISTSGTRSMNVEASMDVLARSRRNRREIRMTGYRRFLAGGRTRSIQLRRVKVRTPKASASLQGQRSRELRNLIVGLLDKERYLLNIGILIDVEMNVLRVYSRYIESVQEIEMGFIKLSTDGTELGYYA